MSARTGGSFGGDVHVRIVRELIVFVFMGGRFVANVTVFTPHLYCDSESSLVRNRVNYYIYVAVVSRLAITGLQSLIKIKP